jgi:DegV family protein with EDD domain
VSIKLILDSSADLTSLEGVAFSYAPLKVCTAEREFIDNDSGDAAAMVEYLAAFKGRSSTSCPNVEDWIAAFGEADRILCVTITGGLSGSYNAACTAGKLYEEAHPDRRVAVMDSLTAGPEIALIAERARDLALEGKSLFEIVEELGRYRTELIFVLESLKNFANNGRVSRTAAAAAGFLGIRAVGRASEQGTLEMLTKARGETKALDAVMDYLFDRGYKGGKLAIHHCMADATVTRLTDLIRAAYPTAVITVRRTRCLCSYYAERGGFLVGFEN